MLPIRTIAANPGWPLTLAHHEFRAGADGQLEHYIDDDLRAVIPPEGWDDYARAWPVCADLVSQLKRPAPAAAAADPGPAL